MVGRARRRRCRCTAATDRPVEPVNLVRSTCGGKAGSFRAPSWADSEAATRVLPGCAVVRLHRPVSPRPTGRNGLKSIRACTETQYIPSGESDCRTKGYAQGGRPPRVTTGRGGSRPGTGKAPAVGVERTCETCGRSRAIEVDPIRVNRLHRPTLAAGHDKVVGELSRRKGQRPLQSPATSSALAPALLY